jgi:hypothetical protein
METNDRQPLRGERKSALLVASGLLSALALLAPGHAEAITRQGLDLNAYCRQTYGSSAYATLLQNNAYGWSCRLGTQNLVMDLNAACRQQYTDAYAAAFYDYYNASSWHCQLRRTYTSFSGTNHTLYIWLGRNVALMTPDANGYVPSLMNLVNAIDSGYDFYFNATGRRPSELTATVYQGRATHAALPSGHFTGCGSTAGACGYLGFTGVEYLNSTYNTMYSAVHNNGLYDQTPFYELGRNFWFYGNKLEYKSPDTTGSVTTGYAVAMRFLAMSYVGVSGAPFNGVAFTTFRTEVERLVDTYRNNSSLNWSNTLRVGQAPSNSYGLGGTDFFASFVLRLRKVHGQAFIDQLWKRAAARPDAVTTQNAVDNFVIAASQAAGVNLHGLFTTTWKWPVSTAARDLLQSTLGSPVSSTPYL